METLPDALKPDRQRTVPIHVGQPIEWKPLIVDFYRNGFRVPIHVGQPIEWKRQVQRGDVVPVDVPIHVGQPIEWKREMEKLWV